MTRFQFLFSLTILAAGLVAVQTQAAELYGLEPSPVELKSVGPMAFGPDSVLFVGDPKAAKVYALQLDDKQKVDAHYNVEQLDTAIAKACGGKMSIVDMAINPSSGNVFVGLTGQGKNLIAKVTSSGDVSLVSMDKIGNASATMPNAPEDKEVRRGRRRSNARNSSITDLAYTDGKVLVAGLEAGDAPSAIREFDFPFREQSEGMSVEIYHAAHGRSEDYAAIQTFVPFNIGGEPSLLAGYTCTPLVKIPVGKIGDKKQVTGTTVAELGNRNRPLDMIHYKRGDKDFLLMANSSRGVMRISTDGLTENDGLTKPVSGGGTAGQEYTTIDSLKGVVQLSKYDDGHAVVISTGGNGMVLKTIHLP